MSSETVKIERICKNEFMRLLHQEKNTPAHRYTRQGPQRQRCILLHKIEALVVSIVMLQTDYVNRQDARRLPIDGPHLAVWQNGDATCPTSYICSILTPLTWDSCRMQFLVQMPCLCGATPQERSAAASMSSSWLCKWRSSKKAYANTVGAAASPAEGCRNHMALLQMFFYCLHDLNPIVICKWWFMLDDYLVWEVAILNCARAEHEPCFGTFFLLPVVKAHRNIQFTNNQINCSHVNTTSCSMW